MTIPIVFIIVALYAGVWKIFEKAGIPGWKSIIPIYNNIMVLKLLRKPWWWLFLLVIPGVNIVVCAIIFLDLAECFGKGIIFGAGLAILPFIFLPLLGFGGAKYTPPERG